MDMQTPQRENEPALGQLLERLVDDSADLFKAEMRIAEAKLARRVQIAALPLGLLSMSVALGLIALMAGTAAIVVMLIPVIGLVWAISAVTVFAAAASAVLFAQGRRRLSAVWEPPPVNRLRGDHL